MGVTYVTVFFKIDPKGLYVWDLLFLLIHQYMGDAGRIYIDHQTNSDLIYENRKTKNARRGTL